MQRRWRAYLQPLGCHGWKNVIHYLCDVWKVEIHHFQLQTLHEGWKKTSAEDNPVKWEMHCCRFLKLFSARLRLLWTLLCWHCQREGSLRLTTTVVPPAHRALLVIVCPFHSPSSMWYFNRYHRRILESGLHSKDFILRWSKNAASRNQLALTSRAVWGHEHWQQTL